MVQAVFAQRPHLILCGHLNFSPIALWIHRLLRIPYWLLVYGMDAWDVDNSQRICALKQADRIISISEYTRDRLIQEQQLPGEQISILPVTFDATRFTLAAKSSYLLDRYQIQPDQPILLTVARLADSDRFKGYDQVLKALSQIRQTLPNVHYLIVGKGRDRPRIERLIEELELQDCVTLTGFVPDEELGDHYNLCDVFAMPSKREGFGIVYLEALACGKPALGGNQDGAVDALCGGKLGALVDPDDIEAIAQSLIQMLQGTYPNPLMYQPGALRQAVINTYGMAAFQRRLADLLQEQGIIA
jgi:glycosyltransferase involved in cell wall biosynthesis